MFTLVVIIPIWHGTHNNIERAYRRKLNARFRHFGNPEFLYLRVGGSGLFTLLLIIILHILSTFFLLVTVNSLFIAAQ